MSSNIRIKKVCQHCNKLFTAKTTVTKYCSDTCAKKAYKIRMKEIKVVASNNQTKNEMLQTISTSRNEDKRVIKELVSIKELTVIVGLSESTLFRLIKDKKFPRLKVGKRLLFNKESVINYMNFKYGTI